MWVYIFTEFLIYFVQLLISIEYALFFFFIYFPNLPKIIDWIGKNHQFIVNSGFFNLISNFY